MIGGIVWMVNIHCEALEVGGGYLIPLPFLLFGEENFIQFIILISLYLVVFCVVRSLCMFIEKRVGAIISRWSEVPVGGIHHFLT